MECTSYYDPLLCLHRCTKYSQLPLITSEKKCNTRSDATSWAHGAEWQQERSFDQNCEIELRKANNETIPNLPDQLGKK